MVTAPEELELLLSSLAYFHHSLLYLLPQQTRFRLPLEENVYFSKLLLLNTYYLFLSILFLFFDKNTFSFLDDVLLLFPWSKNPNTLMRMTFFSTVSFVEQGMHIKRQVTPQWYYSCETEHSAAEHLASAMGFSSGWKPASTQSCTFCFHLGQVPVSASALCRATG